MTAPTKKRKPAAVLPNKTHKSQERVVESSDDETQETMTTTTSMTTTTTGTESETESGSESGSETERDNKPAKTTPKPAKTTPKPAKTTAKPTKTHTYAPPPHFTLAPVPTDGRSNPFSDRNLAGKELWFITAPIAAPLSKLAVVNLADIAASAPVMQTGSGKQYCIRSHDAVEEEIEGVELAVHDGRGGYRIAGKKIVKSFQVVEMLPVPAAVADEPRLKPVRRQPDGLWMRFKPIGYVGAQNEDANVEVAKVEVEVRGHGEGEHRKKRRREGGERGEKKKHRSKEKHGSRNITG